MVKKRKTLAILGHFPQKINFQKYIWYEHAFMVVVEDFDYLCRKLEHDNLKKRDTRHRINLLQCAENNSLNNFNFFQRMDATDLETSDASMWNHELSDLRISRHTT